MWIISLISWNYPLKSKENASRRLYYGVQKSLIKEMMAPDSRMDAPHAAGPKIRLRAEQGAWST